MNGRTIKLSEVHKGSLDQIFQGSMLKVVENIHDMNTEAGAKREVNIKITIKPDKEDRDKAEMLVSCSEKLAPRKNLESTFFSGVDIDTGEVAMREHVQEQMDLFPQPPKVEGADSVVVDFRDSRKPAMG